MVTTSACVNVVCVNVISVAEDSVDVDNVQRVNGNNADVVKGIMKKAVVTQLHFPLHRAIIKPPCGQRTLPAVQKVSVPYLKGTKNG